MNNYEQLKNKMIKLYEDYFSIFLNRTKELEAIKKEIQEKCTPEEIYIFEFINHECAYTNDDTEALNTTRFYFENFEPAQELIEKILNEQK